MGRMPFKTASFHVEYGPDVLFERVRYVMGKKAGGARPTKHFMRRAEERGVPRAVLDAVADFRAAEWDLVSCGARTDKGKFVKSVWKRHFDDGEYWLAIGLAEGAMTVIRKDGGSGKEGAVRGGELYEFVRQVNQALMDEDLAGDGSGPLRT